MTKLLSQKEMAWMRKRYGERPCERQDEKQKALCEDSKRACYNEDFYFLYFTKFVIIFFYIYFLN